MEPGSYPRIKGRAFHGRSTHKGSRIHALTVAPSLPVVPCIKSTCSYPALPVDRLTPAHDPAPATGQAKACFEKR